VVAFLITNQAERRKSKGEDMPIPADPNKDPDGGAPPADPSDGGEPKGDDDPKTFSQEDLDKLAAKVRQEAKDRADKDLEKRLADEKADWERQAKLSAEEKASEELKKQEAALAKQAHDLAIRENRVEAHATLQEKSLPVDFIDLLVDEDNVKTTANIDKFEKAWNKALSEAVDKKLAGKTPVDKTPPSGGKSGEKTSTHDLLFSKKG
jgi:membrane protein involved in colicin uptake